MAKRFWRALGFLDVDDDEPAFTDMDIEAVQLFQSMVALGLVDLDSAVQMARVIGSSMARIAEAEAAPGPTPILHGHRATASSTPTEFARQAGDVDPGHGPAARVRVAPPPAGRHPPGHAPPDPRGPTRACARSWRSGFADMVGFTMLSQHLGRRGAGRRGRPVRGAGPRHGGRPGRSGGQDDRRRGDVRRADRPTGAAQIGLSLAEAYAGDDLLSDVRVALAVGPVLVKDGDFYGPVVNLASRLVNVARPGHGARLRRVPAARSTDEGADGHRHPAPPHPEPEGPRPRPDVEALRAGSEPGADSRRTMRWERLGEVLRELDELRERGEQAGRRSVTRVDAGSRPSQPDGGDPVGS